MDMRKFFGLLMIALTMLLFSCGGQVQKVEYLRLSMNPGTLPPAYYFESDLSFVPDYRLRSLSVYYQIVYPYGDETSEEDFYTEGIIGGENFDRFEEILLVLDEESDEVVEESCVGGHSFGVEFRPVDREKINKDFYICGDMGENLKLMESFYLDVVEMLTTDLY